MHTRKLYQRHLENALKYISYRMHDNEIKLTIQISLVREDRHT